VAGINKCQVISHFLKWRSKFFNENLVVSGGGAPSRICLRKWYLVFHEKTPGFFFKHSITTLEVQHEEVIHPIMKETWKSVREILHQDGNSLISDLLDLSYSHCFSMSPAAILPRRHCIYCFPVKHLWMR